MRSTRGTLKAAFIIPPAGKPAIAQPLRAAAIHPMARYDDMVSPPGMDDDESDDEICGSGAQHKAKPRRKSHQRPQVGAGTTCCDHSK